MARLLTRLVVIAGLCMGCLSNVQAYTSHIEDATARNAATWHFHYLQDNVGAASTAGDVVRQSNDSALLVGPSPLTPGGMAWVRSSQELDLHFENGQSHVAKVNALAAVDAYHGLMRLEGQQASFTQVINRPPSTFGAEGFGLAAGSSAGLSTIYAASLSDSAAASFATDGPRTLRLTVALSGTTTAGATATLNLNAFGRDDWSADSAVQHHSQELSFSGAWAQTVVFDLSLDRLWDPYGAWTTCAAWGGGTPWVNCKRLDLKLGVGASLSLNGGEGSVDIRLGRPELLDDTGVQAVFNGADWGLPDAMLALPVPEPSAALLLTGGLVLLRVRVRGFGVTGIGVRSQI